MDLLHSHPAVSSVLNREILLGDVLHFEIIVCWEDGRLSPRSFFIWPTQQDAIASALRAANNREEILNNIFDDYYN